MRKIALFVFITLITSLYADEYTYFTKIPELPCYKIWNGDKELLLHTDEGIQILGLFYDEYNDNIWTLCFLESERTYHLHNLLSGDSVPLPKDIKVSTGVCVYNNVFVFIRQINSNFKITLYDIASTQLNVISYSWLLKGLTYFTVSGFDGDKLFFDQGYYSVQTQKVYLYPHPQSEEWSKNRICPKEHKVILTNKKNKKIYLYDYETNALIETPIKVDYKYLSNEERYFVSQDVLYYTRQNKSLRKILAVFFPGGVYIDSTWYSFNLKTKEKQKIKLHAKGAVTFLHIKQ